MGKGTRCKSGSHQIFKDRAKSRVEDLQVMFTDLQCARKESRGIDVAVVEEQVYQMLKEWKNELNQPSPASSLQQGASVELSSPDISRLLQLCNDEDDDATSGLAAPKPDPDGHKSGENAAFHELQDFAVTQTPQEQSFQKHKGSPSGVNNNNNMDTIANQLDNFSYDLPLDFDPIFFSGGLDGMGQENDLPPQMPGYYPTISPPPFAFLGPKCALWDCPRPAQGWCSDRPVQGWFPDYCSGLHAATAQNEGQFGMTPVLRPKGIELKDSLLFAALSAKSQGKDVGVPECEGAATTKSPWNAPELFDLSVFDGETLREWLFFDKPRRAFESGNRKQRSLPDYNGRGWHESRKQLMNESGWLKRSYYMDPQPMKFLEWHLYEYEISKSDPCALYRLELKLVDGKKTPKGKIANDSVADLQKQMGRLTAEFQLENNKNNNKKSVKVRGKASLKDNSPGSTIYPGSNPSPPNDGLDSFNYLIDDVGGYYMT
ncbi:putative transcription factor VOZ family [Helianthus annuus]|uniref:Transcription factor VOZ family n=1 Tax=Helianthus annuus TaxID=4232 RepID=A0A251S0Y1_HELAN|nr:transcription factor VOZ1 isoform X1 [Helianthus annuus]XP_022018242.1 transcription factor VOZ1 isoform X1 [Helianthus annuus]XP_022018243.1 transcription factor VOZ1 isoform X1 [Helianthus annuus]KAF5760750.1 putative transcription factor VOZ family [Helianthus annuus]KAJ0438729.1 putative transcription factor VOZ family [Helianthus annuus]KAJ0641508.1 putative transcription factor VOZ family [Helianthus annuus]KAJ0821898.1 putative transcription factor VOZ family [Helianthus annuus]